MDPRTQERVERWDSRPFSGGYDGLSDLADADFSGAVTGAGTWLFMLNGRVVGVFDGSIEEFEGASGTAYEAPDPALPLLCTMEERGGDTRANYYTNETPLREVDETLQSGSFTGYIELSENVLSGDYYAVYYGGRRMAAAYIGNADRLLTGDEAFDRAADEVGIYEVIDVEIDVTDVPGTAPDSSATGQAHDSGTDIETDSSPDTNSSTTTESTAAAEASTDPTESAIESIDLSGSESEPGVDDGDASSPIEDISLEETTEAAGLEDTTDDGTAAADREETTSVAGLEETAEPSGITATDDTEPEPATNGITDTGLTESSDSGVMDDDSSPGQEASAVDDDEPSVSTADLIEEGEQAEPSSPEPTETAGQTARESAPEPEPDVTPDPVEDAETTGSQSQPSTAVESDSDTSPDLAEVEAAAQQLEENNISWTEDDVESSSDDSSAAESAGSTAAESAPEEAAAGESEGTEERFDEEEQWRETRSIPSIDPDNSQSTDSSQRESQSGSGQRARNRQSSTSETDQSAGQRRETATEQQSARRQETSTAQQRGTQATGRATEASSSATANESEPATADASSASTAQLEKYAERIETLEEQRDALATKAEELESEREALQSENQELTSTIDRLQSRIEELEAELKRAREAENNDADAAPSAGTQLPPERALSDTNLFVRYASKSQPTLESAHDGEGDRSDVAGNLRLEHHTGFDATDAAVDGQPYETFLTETMEHRFVNWLTETVLFEIRDTGNADGLSDLYDAIPRIDRAELDATISLEDDDTEDVPDRVSFDVVAFDKMGSPLVVANLNDSREPASQAMLEEMEEAASAVKANYPDLAAAIVVTSSYFEPGALEVADQATSGGFLSRGSKLSYVNLSRKQGYHLCLVESRSEGFHMNAPEL